MIKKPRIVFFLPSLEGGGAERNVVYLVNALNGATLDVGVILAEKKGFFLGQLSKGVAVVDLHSKSLFKLFFVLVKYIRQEKPDIIVSSFPRFNALMLLVKFFCPAVKVVIIEHKAFSLFATTSTSWLHRIVARYFFPWLIKIMYQRADAIICVSKGVRDDLLAIAPLLTKPQVIYNPIVTDAMGQLALESVSEPWLLQSEIPVIVAVGRLIIAKDYPTLLKAFSRVLARQQAYLIILGEGPQRQMLESLAKQLRIESNVKFLGFLENPYAYMARAKVFVLSSLHEGFGNVIVEAMACKTPVISTDCKVGPSEIIENEISGLLVPPANPDTLAGAITRIIADNSLAQRLIDGARRRADYFSVKKSTDSYRTLFLSIIKNHAL